MGIADRYSPMSFTIETERLSLRLRSPADATWYLELLGEHDGGTTTTLAEAQERLTKQNVQARESGLGFLTIELRAECDAIGYCGLLVGRGSFDEPEIAYELLRRARVHGSRRLSNVSCSCPCAVERVTFCSQQTDASGGFLLIRPTSERRNQHRSATGVAIAPGR